MIWLAVIAVVEAVVYQARYRSAVLGGPFAAAWWTFATQALRVAWLAIGVGEFMHGADLVLVIAAYGFPTAIAAGVMRAIDQRRERRDHFGDIAKMVGLNRFVSDQERADAEKHGASRLGPTNTERRS